MRFAFLDIEKKFLANFYLEKPYYQVPNTRIHVAYFFPKLFSKEKFAEIKY